MHTHCIWLFNKIVRGKKKQKPKNKSLKHISANLLVPKRRNELFSMSRKTNYQNYNFRKSRRSEKTVSLLEKQVTIFIGYRKQNLNA